jgi:hypothetical protein
MMDTESGSKAAGSVEQTKNPSGVKKYIIDSGAAPEDVLRLDSEGADLVFEQTEKFLPLSDAVVSKLGRVNKLRYTTAKEFHDSWRGAEHAEFVERFKVDRQMIGSATNRMDAKPTSKGLFARWTRPDRVEEMLGKGYKVLQADEAKSYLGSKGGHHEIGKLGQTELVLMGIDKKIHDEMMVKRTQKNNEIAGSYKQQALAEMSRDGGQPFTAVDDGQDRRDWNVLPPSGK